MPPADLIRLEEARCLELVLCGIRQKAFKHLRSKSFQIPRWYVTRALLASQNAPFSAVYLIQNKQLTTQDSCVQARTDDPVSYACISFNESSLVEVVGLGKSRSWRA